MTTSIEQPSRLRRTLVARLFAAALEGDQSSERDLHVLAFDLPQDRSAITGQACRALAVLGGPRPDGACPSELRRTDRRAWATSYADQLRADFDRRRVQGSRGSTWRD